jgi:hypothetical protein
MLETQAIRDLADIEPQQWDELVRRWSGCP